MHHTNHLVAILIAVLAVSVGCRKQENIKTSPIKPEIPLRQPRSDQKIINLSKDTVYLLSDDVVIISGQQLIIEGGTLIKSGYSITDIPFTITRSPGFKSITIRSGGILLINGTEDAPVVFTSSSPRGTQSINWGGITIEGKSTNNSRTGAVDAADFSGTIRYCRIEFAPLTLTAVGNRTIIENVMVSYVKRNGVSAYNIFGGTFNAKNLISYACDGPADFFITNGYTGKMQNLLAYRHPFFGSTGSTPPNALAGIFIQNNSSNPVNAVPMTFPLISNLTVLGPNGQNGSTTYYNSSSVRAAAIVTTGNSRFDIRNSIFSGFPKSSWIIDDFNTARAVENRHAGISNTFFQCNDTANAFFLTPGSYPPFLNSNFKNFILNPFYNNQLLLDFGLFGFIDPFNYNAPSLVPGEGSPVLIGAKFEGSFTDTFFNKVTNIGAFGSADWTKPWSNFTPLKTNYNFSE